jgi:hypothetical protein
MEIKILHDNYRFFTGNPRFGFVGTMYGRIMDIWIRVLEEGRASGEFQRGINPKFAGRAILGSLETTVRWFDPRGLLSIGEIANQYADLYVDGLVGTSRMTANKASKRGSK